MDGNIFINVASKTGIPGLMVDRGVGGTITLALPYVFGIAGVVLLFNIISSGLKMMTSGGDPKSLQSAQGKLSTSAIGILILFTSFWIVNLILKFFGLSFDGGSNIIQ